jgi:hypothetical protein
LLGRKHLRQSQPAIRLPRFVWSHDLFLHGVLVCQQPQKAQLGKAAEHDLLVLKIAEPAPGRAMKAASLRG